MIYYLSAGLIFSGISVLLGAFGAHALKTRISAEMLDIFEVGVRYQMYHSLGLILLGLAFFHFSSQWLQIAGLCFIGGIVLFSGSLYILSLTETRWWGAITPLGGVLFILGWVFFVIGVNLSKNPDL